MIVCHCRVVSSGAVDAAVAGGAATLAKVCQATGAGRDCGSCVLAVKELIVARRATLATTALPTSTEVPHIPGTVLAVVGGDPG
ncbi:MAG: (2Fe-2S)-binding protein [Nocardioides sp.]